MKKKIGLLVMGIAVGLVLTELIQEEMKQRAVDGADTKSPKRNGRFAEITGRTVRIYEVKDGHFCGYSLTKEFENAEKAMEWAVKEADAKIVIRETE